MVIRYCIMFDADHLFRLEEHYKVELGAHGWFHFTYHFRRFKTIYVLFFRLIEIELLDF